MLFFREKPLVKSTAPGSLLYCICLRDLVLFSFIFRSINLKTKRYLVEFYLLLFAFNNLTQLLSRLLANFWRRYPKRIDNPFNTSGREYLLFACRCHSRSIAWFSYWFDNHGLVIDGNTYHCCAASSLHFWGNTDVVQADISRLHADRPAACTGGRRCRLLPPRPQGVRCFVGKVQMDSGDKDFFMNFICDSDD